jgi:hypothetical protein
MTIILTSGNIVIVLSTTVKKWSYTQPGCYISLTCEKKILGQFRVIPALYGSKGLFWPNIWWYLSNFILDALQLTTIKAVTKLKHFSLKKLKENSVHNHISVVSWKQNRPKVFPDLDLAKYLGSVGSICRSSEVIYVPKSVSNSSIWRACFIFYIVIKEFKRSLILSKAL